MCRQRVAPAGDGDNDRIAMVIDKLVYAAAWRSIWSLMVIAFALGGISLRAEAGDVLTGVRSRGAVRCGVSEGLLGFSLKEPNGRWGGLDADFCRAVAAAALGIRKKSPSFP